MREIRANFAQNFHPLMISSTRANCYDHGMIQKHDRHIFWGTGMGELQRERGRGVIFKLEQNQPMQY